MNESDTTSRWKTIIEQLAGDAPRLLMLDYDGTLAPFQVERDKAFMLERYRKALEEIRRAGKTRVVVISGRAIADLLPLLSMYPPPEIWGSHGWERLTAEGVYVGPGLSEEAARALEQAREAALESSPEGALEIKPASAAVHWRGMDSNEAGKLAERILAAWRPLVDGLDLEIHEFDGGLEFRATGRDKGFAAAQILRETPPETIAVYAGDDYTDEDAFRAVNERGHSILVRQEFRETAATMWLKPPDDWGQFLEDWMRADAGGK